VLGVTFLSGFALELGASLSVALMAVSIGFRLIDGAIPLSVGLFVLLLAPEAYLPMRNVGANFHAAAEGVLASETILDAIDHKVQSSTRAAVTPAAEKFTVLVGPSGAGKTTALEAYRQALPSSAVAWLPQGNQVFAGSVLENLVGPGSRVDDLSAQALVEIDRAMSLAALDDLELSQAVGESGAAISGGQRQRLGLARAILRASAHPSVSLLLDEPISAVDPVRAALIVANLRKLADGGLTIVAVSHQDELVSAADVVIEVAK
jgi:ATP-binding cassette subfamily C protein CydD